LTYRINGLEPNIEDFLAFTAVSTPTFYENVGGINVTLYDSTKTDISRRVVNELKRAIPPDISKLHTVETPYGKLGIRYKYAFLDANAEKKLSKTMHTFLANKTTQHITHLEEASLSLYSTEDKPRTIEDPPCSLSDIPTVLPEETSVDGRAVDPEFDSFKYMLITQMKTPTIQDYSDSMVSIVNNLEKLREKWGLDPRHIAQYGFLNANYNARPTSILRKALAYGRIYNKSRIKPEDVSRVFKEYFEWNFKYLNEIWMDLLKPGRKILPSLRVKYRDIIRIITNNESSKAPEVSLETIIAESELPSAETIKLLNDCRERGVIYESPKGFYRLVHN
jgi:hypothetical protein